MKKNGVGLCVGERQVGLSWLSWVIMCVLELSKLDMITHDNPTCLIMGKLEASGVIMPAALASFNSLNPVVSYYAPSLLRVHSRLQVLEDP